MKLCRFYIKEKINLGGPLSQHSHYPPWCLPRSWYRLHSWGCWAQPSPADSAETWEHRRTEESDRRGSLKREQKQLIAFCFPKQPSFSCVRLTSSWTRCSRFLYVFWTSSLVPSTPYHIMFLVRLLQEETGGRNQSPFMMWSPVWLMHTEQGFPETKLQIIQFGTADSSTIPMSLGCRCHREEASQFVGEFVNKTHCNSCWKKSKIEPKSKSESVIFSFHPLLVANVTELSALWLVCCRNAPLESSASPKILRPRSWYYEIFSNAVVNLVHWWFKEESFTSI